MKRFVFGMLCAFLLGASLSACSSDVGGEPPPEEQKPNIKEPKEEEPKEEEPKEEEPKEEGPDGIGGEELENYPAIKTFLENIERARTGEAVDFDGDGHKEFSMWFDESGVRHVEANGPPNRKYRYTSEMHPDGSYKTTYSAYADGIIDTHEEQRGDGKKVTLYDTNRDGEFDKRETLMLTDAPEFFRAIDEKRTPGGEWETVRDELVSTTVRTLRSHTSSMRVPPLSAQRTANANVIEPRLGFNIITSGDGHCSPEERRKVLDAIDDIFENSLPCLETTRPAMATAIKEAFERNHTVRFYCGFEGEENLGPGDAGIARPGRATRTGVWICNAAYPCTIKINRVEFNKSRNIIQENVLHELLHTLGFNTGNSDEHDKGTDETYSCSRYCSGCNSGHGFISSNTDCESCADTLEQKEECNPPAVTTGMQEVGLTGPCPEEFGVSRNLCGSGFACLGSAQRCEVCRYTVYQNCDDMTPVAYGRLLCCDTCPSNCPFNPVPCQEEGSNYNLFNNCKSSLPPPPFCPGGKNP